MDANTDGLTAETEANEPLAQGAVKEDGSLGPTPEAADDGPPPGAAKDPKDAQRQKRRAKRSKLDAALLQKRCRHCLTVGQFGKVYATRRRIRYVHCLACGKTEQVAI